MKVDLKGAGYYEVIHFSGYFDLEKLYHYIYSWLSSNKYKYNEKLYKQKKSEIEWEIEGTKKVDGYAKFSISFALHLYGDGNGPTPVDPVEVVKDGVKRKLVKGRVRITISGGIETGYSDIFGENKWNKTYFRRWIQNFFEKAVLKQDIDIKYVDKLYYEILDFYEGVKKVLGMYAVGSFY